MKRGILLAAVVLGLTGFGTLPARSADAPTSAPAKAEKAAKKDDGDEKETKIKLEDCPKAVQDAITKTVGAGKVGDISKEEEAGKATYEVDATIDGKDHELKIAEDGTVLKNKREDDDKDEEKGAKAGKDDDDDDKKGKAGKEDDDDNEKKPAAVPPAGVSSGK